MTPEEKATMVNPLRTQQRSLSTLASENVNVLTWTMTQEQLSVLIDCFSATSPLNLTAYMHEAMTTLRSKSHNTGLWFTGVCHGLRPVLNKDADILTILADGKDQGHFEEVDLTQLSIDQAPLVIYLFTDLTWRGARFVIDQPMDIQPIMRLKIGEFRYHACYALFSSLVTTQRDEMVRHTYEVTLSHPAPENPTVLSYSDMREAKQSFEDACLHIIRYTPVTEILRYQQRQPVVGWGA